MLAFDPKALATLGFTLAYVLRVWHWHFSPYVEELWCDYLRRLVGRLSPGTCSRRSLEIWVFYGFARGPTLIGKAGPGLLMKLAVVGFVVQIVLARVWLKWFRFGPAEWLWRSLTYGRLQPFSVLSSDASQHAAGGASR